MTPIRFGQSARQLFGLYEAAHGSVARGESILLCPPFGQEAIRSHRLFKVLADRLCRDGFHVLRFDYFGTGDSLGEGEAVCIEGLVADVLTANNELMSRSGCSSTSWMGLRLGATVAALASGQAANKLERLLLWEPVTNGAAYLQELGQAHTAALLDAYEWRALSDENLRAAVAREAGHEALGFPITDLFRSELDALNVASFVNTSVSRVHIFDNPAETRIASDDGQAESSFAKALNARGLETRVTQIIEKISWTADEMMNAASVPGEVLQKIVACVARDSSPDSVTANAVASLSDD